MNIKKATNSQLSTTESKTKQKWKQTKKQLEQEQNHRDGGHMEGYLWEGGQW